MGSVKCNLSESYRVIKVVFVIWMFLICLCSGLRIYPYRVKNVSVLYNYDMKKNLSLSALDEMYGTCHSIEDAIKVIKREQDRTHKVRELLDIYYNHISTSSEVKPKGPKYPYIVLEGIDYSGRQGMALHLANSFGGEFIENPPLSIRHYYPSLLIHTSEFRRAFFVLGHYMAAHSAKQLIYRKPVFMDRCWHNIAAFCIAKTFSRNRTKLPLPQSPIYQWPSDLFKPDLIFFLKITRRMVIKCVRDKAQLDDKKQSRIFRIMKGQAHEEFIDPGAHVVNANYNKKYIYRVTKFRLKRLFREMGIEGF